MSVQIDKTVSSVPQRPVVESFVAGEERWAATPQQHRSDRLVRHATAPDVNADLLDPDTPAFEQQALALRNILIEDVHADCVASTNSSACLDRAWLASCTASRMASTVTLRFHSSMIVFHAMPLAT